jgi:hypothetical protein
VEQDEGVVSSNDPAPPFGVSRWRARLADALGLVVLLLALCDYLRPSLMLLPTVMAGGDTPCHFPTFVWFRDHLLPQGRLHGWYPGAYLGQPVLLYYFPLPFLVMSGLSTVFAMPVAFKLGVAGGIFALPLAAYVSFRAMRLPFPAPLLGAAAATVFLFNEENPIWGGTMASTMTGEFAYQYGIGLALLFLGVAYRAHQDGRSPVLPGVMLAITGLAHGYAVLWAGLSAAYFLYAARRPARTLAWLSGVAALSFALAGFWLFPLLSDWGWTTPYHDAWITVSPRNLVPPLLWPLVGLSVVAVVAALRGRLAAEHRVLFLAHAGLVGACLGLAGPALGIIDIRFLPFAQLALCLVTASAAGLALQTLVAADVAALGLVAACIFYGDASSRIVRYWIDYNYTGLEAKELWPAYRRLADLEHATVNDARVAVEYSAEHERAGSIRMYETIPFFSGRSTLEGVYNQASLSTHPVYFLASELGATSPNPFKSRDYSRFDTPSALAHLRLFNASDIVALSPQLVTSLSARADVRRVAEVPPYSVFRLLDPGAGYVEPLAFEPVRSAPRGFRDKAYRWFTRKPLSPAFLVFSDDARFKLAEPDEWLAPPLVPLPGGVTASATLEPERIRIHTSTVGHPLLVKVSYHPRWRAIDADGPYLVSPSLMMVIPRKADVTLVYGRTASDFVGLGSTVLGLGIVAAAIARARRRGVAQPVVAGGRRWGGAIPAALLVLLASSRLLYREADSATSEMLSEKASRAFAADRFVEAAEYARNGLHGAPRELRSEMLCVRGESLLRAGDPAGALEAFSEVTRDGAERGHRAQALSGVVRAALQSGDPGAGADARARLLTEYPGTPWAAQVR